MVGIFLNSFVQILGLATVLPVIGMVTKPEIITDNPYLARAFAFFNGFGIDTPNQFIALSAFGLIVAFSFKSLFTLTLQWLQSRFSMGIGHRLSGEMWAYHFSHSLERMRKKKSGRVLAEINNWPLGFAGTFLVGNLSLINNLIVVAAISVGLLVYEPVILLSIAALLVTGGAIQAQGYERIIRTMVRVKCVGQCRRCVVSVQILVVDYPCARVRGWEAVLYVATG